MDVVIRRPGWLGWALGSLRDERLTVRAPVARTAGPSLSVAPGAPVRIRFEQPVSSLSYATGGQPAVRLALAGPTSTVTLAGLGGAGTAEISAAVRPWEKLGPPLAVTWLPPSSEPVVLASPAPGSNLAPAGTITLTFSKPVASLLGSPRGRRSRRPRPARGAKPTATRWRSRRQDSARRSAARCASRCPPRWR